MKVSEEIVSGRRTRSENGFPRDSQNWTIRDVDQATRYRISSLSLFLEATVANVLQLAVKNLQMKFLKECQQETPKSNTLSPPDDWSWLLNKSTTSSNNPVMQEFELKLQERCNRRDEIMGRNTDDTPTEASTKLGGVDNV